MIVIGYKSFSNTISGYEYFVKAFDKTISEKNTSKEFEYSIRENGTTNMSGIMRTLSNEEMLYGINDIKIKDRLVSTEFEVDDSYIQINSNGIYSREERGLNFPPNYSPQTKKFIKRFARTGFSMVLGDSKKFFIKEGNTVKINLERSQIPSTIKILFGMAAHENFTYKDTIIDEETFEYIDTYSGYNNVEVDVINAEFEINDDRIVSYYIIVDVVANDRRGIKNILEFEIRGNINYGNVEMKSIDTEGLEMFHYNDILVE